MCPLFRAGVMAGLAVGDFFLCNLRRSRAGGGEVTGPRRGWGELQLQQRYPTSPGQATLAELTGGAASSPPVSTVADDTQ